jgi:hypothetical protein
MVEQCDTEATHPFLLKRQRTGDAANELQKRADEEQTCYWLHVREE